jgi:hypothetical protein
MRAIQHSRTTVGLLEVPNMTKKKKQSDIYWRGQGEMGMVTLSSGDSPQGQMTVIPVLHFVRDWDLT